MEIDTQINKYVNRCTIWKRIKFTFRNIFVEYRPSIDQSEVTVTRSLLGCIEISYIQPK